MKCTAYIRYFESDKDQIIRPIYEISLDLEGADSLVNQLKTKLTERKLTLTELTSVIDNFMLDKNLEQSQDRNRITGIGVGNSIVITLSISNILQNIHQYDINNFLKQSVSKYPKINNDLPLVNDLYSGLDVSTKINFLTEEMYDEIFGTKIQSDGAFFQNEIFIKVKKLANKTYKETIDDIKKYIDAKVSGKEVYNEDYESYFQTIIHESLHPKIRITEPYTTILDNASIYSDQQEKIANKIPKRYVDIHQYLSEGNYAKFFEEVFVHYNAGSRGFDSQLDDFKISILHEQKSKQDKKSNVNTITFDTASTSGYKERTRTNASADATIAIAVNFESAGEKLTKKSVLEQGKKYIPVDIDYVESNDEFFTKTVWEIVNELNSVNAKTLNIAGNGIYTMQGKYTQQEIDEFTYQLLKAVIESPELKNKITSIRTGGQTGFDEAGAKAGIKLGIPTLVYAPKDWAFRDITGTDISNDEQAFKARFLTEGVEETDNSEDPVFSVEVGDNVIDIDKKFLPTKLTQSNLEKFKQLAFKPYTRIQNNDRVLIHNLQPNDIVYIKWTIQGNKEPIYSPYFVQHVSMDGEQIIIYGKKLNSLIPDPEKETSDGIKKIIISYDEDRRQQSKFVADAVAFRKYSGMRRHVDMENFSLAPAMTTKNQKLILKNIELWDAQFNPKNKDNPDVPKFMIFNGSETIKSFQKKDKVGFYMRLGGNTNYKEESDIVTLDSKFGEMIDTSQDLADATFNLLKIGDIVQYTKWSNNKPSRIFGIVTNKFTEGLMVTPLDDYGKKKEFQEIPINRKDLYSAYVFFDKESNRTILDELDDFEKALNGVALEKNPDKKIFETSLAFKPIIETLRTSKQQFRPMKMVNGEFQLATEESYFYPGDTAIAAVYEDQPYPIAQYSDAEKLFLKHPKQAYFLSKGKLDELLRLSKDASKEDVTLIEQISRTNSLFAKYFIAKQNRKARLENLRQGSIAYVKHRKRYKDQNGEMKTWPDSDTYGMIVAKSDFSIVVALKRNNYDPSTNKWTSDGWYFQEINITDMRKDLTYEVLQVRPNLAMESALLESLMLIKQASAKSFQESKKSLQQKVEQLTTELENEDFIKNQDESETGLLIDDVRSLGDVWKRIDFFTNSDYNEENEFTLTSQDIHDRQLQRDKYVAMLETGSFVMYRSGQTYTDDKGEKIQRKAKQFIVVGKNLKTGMPILAKVSTKSYKATSGETVSKKFIDTFEPNIEHIVGVGLFMQKDPIEIARIDLDGQLATVKLNPNERFQNELMSFLTQYVEYAKVPEYKSEEEVVEAIKQIEEESVQRFGDKSKVKYVQKLTYIIRDWKDRVKSVDAETMKKYKSQEVIEKVWKIYQVWPDGNQQLYRPTNWKISFNAKVGDKWQSPAGFQAIDMLKQGTLIEMQPPGYKYPFYGIVFAKNETSMTMIKLHKDADLTRDLSIEDLQFYETYYHVTNEGTQNNPIWKFVLPSVRSIQFLQRPNPQVYEKLKQISTEWKSKTLAGDYGQMLVTDQNKIIQLSVQERSRILKAISDRNNIKSSIGLTDRATDIENVKRYAEKFTELYGIKFNYLSSKQIEEDFEDGLILSKHRAFKMNGEIYINVDLATLEEPFHEMQHVIMEVLEAQNKPLYDELMSITRAHPKYDLVALKYPHLQGQDLDEEVFATIVGQVYADNLTDSEQRWKDENKSVISRFFSWLKSLFNSMFDADVDIDDMNFITESQKDILIKFGADLLSGKYQGIVKNDLTIIKKGVPELFEQNPELAKIGTPQQYSQYLDTVFPDSKVKDILWHSTIDMFDKYDKTKTRQLSKDLGYTLNLSLDRTMWDDYAEEQIPVKVIDNPNFTIEDFKLGSRAKTPKYILIPEKGYKVNHLAFLVNIQNAYYTEDYYQDKLQYQSNSKKDFDKQIQKKHDAIVEKGGLQVAIFSEENYLRLGSEEDIERFEQFVRDVMTSPSNSDKDPITRKIEEMKNKLFEDGNLNAYCS